MDTDNTQFDLIKLNKYFTITIVPRRYINYTLQPTNFIPFNRCTVDDFIKRNVSKSFIDNEFCPPSNS